MSAPADVTVDTSATDRIAALEVALREACEIARSRDTQQPWCRYCGRAWSSPDHLAGPCRIGRGLGVLGRLA